MSCCIKKEIGIVGITGAESDSCGIAVGCRHFNRGQLGSQMLWPACFHVNRGAARTMGRRQLKEFWLQFVEQPHQVVRRIRYGDRLRVGGGLFSGVRVEGCHSQFGLFGC